MTHHIVDGDTQSFTIFQTLLQDHQFHINTFGEEKVSTVVNPSSMKKKTPFARPTSFFSSSRLMVTGNVALELPVPNAVVKAFAMFQMNLIY